MKNNLSGKIIYYFLVLCLGAGVGVGAAWGDQGLLNKLLSPGALIGGHKKLEHIDCLKCHDAGKGVPDSRCLDCHKEIAKSVKKKKSFHGMRKKKCFQCHTDHKGRGFDSTKVDKDDFDHKETGYDLRGKHSKIKCAECHKKKRTKKFLRKSDLQFLGNATSCKECHKKDNTHFYPKKWSKKKCDDCHNEKKWDDIHDFDHTKDTKYKLVAKHAELKCAKCHTDKSKSRGIYKWKNLKQKKCLSCHEDQHKGKLSPKFAGNDCTKCHTQKTWEIKRFDHKVTRYKMEGKHKKLKCIECHKQSAALKNKPVKFWKWKGLKTKCVDCHKNQHKGKFSKKFTGKSCTTCHGQQKWKIDKFDHTITKFSLKGKHQKAKCLDCHKQPKKLAGKKSKFWQWKGLKKNCNDCHKDYHGFANKVSKRFGKLKNCKSCHDENGWKENIDFNHSFDTRWKVTGKHSLVACFQCHKPSGKHVTFKYKKGVSKYNKKTEKKFTKRQYHWNQLNLKTCNTCHANPHKNSFNKKLRKKKCSDCHNTKDWHKILNTKGSFSHNTSTRFAITGKHKKLKCNDCHLKNGRKKYKFASPEKQFCVACHKTVHKGQFSKKFVDKSCIQCHTTKDFRRLKPFNHKVTRFKLTGKHKKIEAKCSKCHTKSNFLLKSKKPKRGRKFIFNHADKKFCESCHKNEHKNQFSSKFSSKSCTSCHTTTKFRKLKRFDHKRTGFILRQKHKKLKCSKCHVPTKKRFSRRPYPRKGKFIFKNLARNECSTCHKDFHKGNLGTACSECHSESSWKKTADFHKNFTLNGVHYTLQCNECHIENRSLEGMSENCFLCHQKDDVHQGTLPECGSCHRQHYWEITGFRHSLSSFPLRGSHRVLDCASCHRSGIYEGTPSECIDCHLQDAQAVVPGGGVPNHNVGGFTDCNDCHNQFIFNGVSL